MRIKLIRLFACLLALLAVLLGALPVSAAENDVQTLIDGIISYKLGQSGAETVQHWIDGALTENAGGSSEWYAVALSQSGKYDFSAYRSALLKYLDKNEVYSASSRQKYALALIATGSTDVYIYKTLNNSIGEQGVASWIYGLHLLNNGYSSVGYTLNAVKQKLLSLQLSDGGWAIRGSTGDVDITAMAVQALAPYYETEQTVKTAVDKALTLLSGLQQTDGDYKSYGVSNPESTAQVLVAVSALGIDCLADSRFVKDGNTLIDGIAKYRLGDGGFCHKTGGAFNETATVQALYSLISYVRMKTNRGSLYLLDARDPAALEKPENVEQSQPMVEKPSETDVTSSKPQASASSSSLSASSSDASQSNESKETESVEIKTQTSEALEETSGGDAENSVGGTAEKSKGVGYKLWVSLAIAVLAGGVCAVLFMLKKRNVRNFILIFAVAAAAVCVVVFTDVRSADSYYQSVGADKENAIGTVTLTVRCDTVSENGIIIDTAELDIEEGETVYDVLLQATAARKIQLETDGSNYVKGINNIYEFDHGDLSGWVYHVNGESPSVGCGEYVLEDGDEVEWLYTLDLGEDVKD